jgi:hypothetical protein
MSATNRGAERREADEYLTPEWAIRRFLEFYQPPGEDWLDPCAANGDLIRVCKAVMGRMRPKFSMAGIELRQECQETLRAATGEDGHYIGDFLAAATGIGDKSGGAIVTNPPYSLLVPFLTECVRIAHVTCMLLRINAVRGGETLPNGEEVKRQHLMKLLNPGIFVLPDRPSFTGYGTDATEYSWFVFGDPEVAGRWFMLGDTPEDEIKAWNKKARAMFPDAKPVKKIKEAA